MLLHRALGLVLSHHLSDLGLVLSLVFLRGKNARCCLLHPSPRSVPALNGAHLSISIIVSICPLQVVFHSPSQQHGFNFPFQIGSFDSMSDSPSQAQRFSVPVEVRTVFQPTLLSCFTSICSVLRPTLSFSMTNELAHTSNAESWSQHSLLGLGSSTSLL